MAVMLLNPWECDGEYVMQCDGGCHRRYPRGSTDEGHLRELARADGWMRHGKRDLCPECRREANQRALRELGEQQARRRSGRRPRP